MSNERLFYALIPSEKIIKADAVILLEGDGYTRIGKACELVRQEWANVLVFSGGIEDLAYGSYPFEMCYSRIFEEGVSHDKIIHENKSKHTREQAENIATLCAERNWHTIILVATHYHQYRAFLTFLKVLEERRMTEKVRLVNAPATADWFEQTPWGIRTELLNSEIEKIELYREKGHISGFDAAVKYLEFWSKKK